MGSVGKVALVSILGLGAITGVLVYYIFGNATPVPGVIESIYRQNLPATEEAEQENTQTQTSSSEGANSTSANSTSANSTSANSTSATT
jgi:hypothetical protein